MMLRRTLLRGAITVAFSAAFAATAFAADPERLSGTLPDNMGPWSVTKPANWNGTIILDLDGGGGPGGGGAPPRAGGAPGGPPGAGAPPVGDPATGAPPAAPAGARAGGPPRANPYQDWLLAQGYAVGGMTRGPVAYEFVKAVDYLVYIRQQFADKYGAPKRTLASGGSRGAFVARMAIERRPDIFQGAYMSAGGGGGQISGLRDRLNTMFTLKTLVDPQSPLELVNIKDVAAAQAAWADIVKKANSTPEGRARLALASAYEQFALWSSRGKPKPAPTDYDAQVDQIAENFAFGNPPSVRAGVEAMAGGNVSWNTDVDYAKLLDKTGRKAMVEAMYKKAGLDLKADLATLAKTPRISADPAAVAKAEKNATYSGKVGGPVVNIDNDDPVDAASYKLQYLDTLKKAGKGDMVRMVWSDGPGHGGVANLDRAVGFKLLIRRLDTGSWGDTSVPALKAMAAEIAKEKPELGKDALFDPGKITPAPFSWDASNWGTYKGAGKAR